MQSLDRESGKSRLFGLSAIVFLGALPVFAGCATIAIVNAQFPERLRDLKSVSIAPPKVQIYEEYRGAGGINRLPSSAESAAAETNFVAAIKQQLNATRQIEIKALDLKRDPQAAREFKFLTFWEPGDLYFIGMTAPPCVPFLHPGSQEHRPLLALREAAQADALLLTCGLSVDVSEQTRREKSRAFGFAFFSRRPPCL